MLILFPFCLGQHFSSPAWHTGLFIIPALCLPVTALTLCYSHAFHKLTVFFHDFCLLHIPAISGMFLKCPFLILLIKLSSFFKTEFESKGNGVPPKSSYLSSSMCTCICLLTSHYPCAVRSATDLVLVIFLSSVSGT